MNPVLAEYRSSPRPSMTSDLSVPSGISNERKTPCVTPLNRGAQSKPHKLVSGTDDAGSVQDKVPSGQIKLEYAELAGHAVGQVKSESGQAVNPGHSTPPSVPGLPKVIASSEEARKLRQAQKKLRQEEWKKKHGGVAGGGGVAPTDPAPNMELVSNGEEVTSQATWRME